MKDQQKMQLQATITIKKKNQNHSSLGIIILFGSLKGNNILVFYYLQAKQHG